MAATVSISYSDSYNTNRPYIFQRVRYIKKKVSRVLCSHLPLTVYHSKHTGVKYS